ncbi:MAG: transglycosylase domain-containing protein, partial [Myxococcales bacterium]|nr:transglycosylase domain-containing protein [Myxococcales bacterium]
MASGSARKTKQQGIARSAPARANSSEFAWRPPKRRRRWLYVLLVLALLVGGVIAAGPYIARWYLINKLLPRIGKRIDRQISVAKADVSYGNLVLEGITVRGKLDSADRPMLRVKRVTAAYRVAPLVRGRVHVPKMVVEEPELVLWRRKDKTSNFTDLVDNYYELVVKRARQGGSGEKLKRALRRRLDSVDIVRGRLDFTDDKLGLKVAGRLKTLYRRGKKAEVIVSDANVDAPLLSRTATFKRLRVLLPRERGAPPKLFIRGGRAALLKSLVFSGVTGSITKKGDLVHLDLAGSYGGAESKLWSAKGWLEPKERRGHVEVRAKRFKLARIAKILERTPVIRPRDTEVSGRLDILVSPDKVRLKGGLSFSDLNLFHPKIAREPVLGLALSTELGATYLRQKDKLEIERGDLVVRGVKAQLTGSVARLRSKKPLVDLKLVAPPVPCQKVIEAFPKSLVPDIYDFKLKGKFSLALSAHVDFADLDKAHIGGRVRYRSCKVVKAPENMSYKRLLTSFEHQVEPAPGQTLTFTVGPENEDFVPYKDVSQNIINAFLTTEDGGFFRHRGFIPSQFRVAIIRNLKKGGFRLGASTISMQMVKNVMLSHEKTFSRKVQELFLTWYLEQHLTKQRIMEIYLNAIEFGPGIYGVGAAARHYFNKSAKDITALEAAFFASILPSPRRRYIQYCRGELSKSWDKYVRRILGYMYKRGRVSEVDWQAAGVEKVVFSKPEDAETEKDCKRRVKDLGEQWRDEARRRLRAAVMKAAPH